MTHPVVLFGAHTHPRTFCACTARSCASRVRAWHVRTARLRALLPMIMVASLSPCAVDAQETYALVARLGRDTMAIERITRSPSRVVADMVEQAPHVIRRHWEATLAPDGSIRRWTMDMYQPNYGPNRAAEWHHVVDFGADSVRASVRSGNQTRNIVRRTELTPTMPWEAFDYGEYELLLAAALRQKGDSMRVGQYFPGHDVLQRGLVTRQKDGSVTFVTSGLSGTGIARFDANGRMLSYSGRRSTYQQEVERVAQVPDIQSIADRWAAREKVKGSSRWLSVRDTARATIGSAALVVDYSRPVARGRSILGSVVPFGDVWRTGANAATQFTTSAPITLAGVALAPGTYTLWTLPTRTGATLIINKQVKQWGTEYDARQDLARRPLTVAKLPSVTDVFTIRLEPGKASAVTSARTSAKATPKATGELVIEWDTFRWRAPITVK